MDLFPQPWPTHGHRALLDTPRFSPPSFSLCVVTAFYFGSFFRPGLLTWIPLAYPPFPASCLFQGFLLCLEKNHSFAGVSSFLFFVLDFGRSPCHGCRETLLLLSSSRTACTPSELAFRHRRSAFLTRVWLTLAPLPCAFRRTVVSAGLHVRIIGDFDQKAFLISVPALGVAFRGHSRDNPPRSLRSPGS